MQITLKVDPAMLEHYSDQYLASYWHAVQAATVDYADRNHCDLAEKIGREIIRRFLAATHPLLWDKQGSHPEFERRLQSENAAEEREAEMLQALGDLLAYVNANHNPHGNLHELPTIAAAAAAAIIAKAEGRAHL